MDTLLVSAGVEHPDPLRVAARDLVITLRDEPLQLDSLALEAIGLAAADPGGRHVGLDPEQDRQVRPDPTGGQIAELLDPLGPQSARHALVSDARVAEAVADHVPSAV